MHPIDTVQSSEAPAKNIPARAAWYLNHVFAPLPIQQSHLHLSIHRIHCCLAHHPLVYNSTPHPQWSSGYDFRLSLTPTSRGRPGFDSLLRSISWYMTVLQYHASSGAGSPASSIFFDFLTLWTCVGGSVLWSVRRSQDFCHYGTVCITSISDAAVFFGSIRQCLLIAECIPPMFIATLFRKWQI